MFSSNSKAFAEISQKSSALDKVNLIPVEYGLPVMNMASCYESNDKLQGTESNSPRLKHIYQPSLDASLDAQNFISNSDDSEYSFKPAIVRSTVLINDDSIKNL